MARDAARALRGAGQHGEAAKLDQLAMRAGKTQMSARDFQSGADQRRKEPMMSALSAAIAGTPGAWGPAMAELAQVALEQERPAWYAAALLGSLGVTARLVGAEAARELCESIEWERGMGGPGYSWDEPEGSASTAALWQALVDLSGLGRALPAN